MMEEQVEVREQVKMEEQAAEEPLILEDVVIETLAIDGICGVY